MILVMNSLLIVGSIISLYDNIFLILIGKTIVGLAIGGYSVYCTNYLNEMVPIELRGPVGSMTSFSVTIGMFKTALFTIAIPDDPDASSFFI